MFRRICFIWSQCNAISYFQREINQNSKQYPLTQADTIYGMTIYRPQPNVFNICNLISYIFQQHFSGDRVNSDSIRNFSIQRRKTESPLFLIQSNYTVLKQSRWSKLFFAFFLFFYLLHHNAGWFAGVLILGIYEEIKLALWQ